MCSFVNVVVSRSEQHYFFVCDWTLKSSFERYSGLRATSFRGIRRWYFVLQPLEGQLFMCPVWQYQFFRRQSVGGIGVIGIVFLGFRAWCFGSLWLLVLQWYFLIDHSPYLLCCMMIHHYDSCGLTYSFSYFFGGCYVHYKLQITFSYSPPAFQSYLPVCQEWVDIVTLDGSLISILSRMVHYLFRVANTCLRSAKLLLQSDCGMRLSPLLAFR